MKKVTIRAISLLCICAFLLSVIPISTFAVSSTDKYLPRYYGSSGSISTALKNIGVDNSYSYRSRIAAKNNITGYKGTAAQNSLMLKYLKAGTLLNPDYQAPESTSSTNQNSNSMYYPRYTGKSSSLVDALRSLKINSSYSFRCKIAKCNGIENYRGTSEQNKYLLNDLLKNGLLKNPEAVTIIGYYNTRAKTNLKSEPYEASANIISLSADTTVMAISKETNKYNNVWYKVMVYSEKGTTEGYIYSNTLKKHSHSYKTFTFNDITYSVCACGYTEVKASNKTKEAEGARIVQSASIAIPATLGVVDGPLPIGDIIGIAIMVVSVCIAHDITLPAAKELSTIITEADFDDYLKKRENTCGQGSFRKVQRFQGTLKYVDNYCMDIVEAYLYVRILGKDVYTPNENNALLLAAMHGYVTEMQRDKDQQTYFYHYHLSFNTDISNHHSNKDNLKAHIFFGVNDFGHGPTW